ncbi:uncharacterized protein FOMMEDRAFT_109294 [Fomitiporia mediterranea MF3/22]|uniref:uncharacterized protein n=1 Tax=Fomitiporia mediterranea (strain MF3/22) TaxID=694068 RepID=UPI0004407A8F|nr:uncharacterized protein FOMMEDRAFT_109294 [Fomitiporia mediterranea MF3/22]EJD02117.1 hypothetical protein FOMMEDRAFT_109294 [Fomitiporia mediterranea MF3/22]
MPRRPPPTSLRLHKGPMPSRGQAKHTLPSVPRPVHVPSDVTRSTVKPAPEPRIMATPPHGSVYSQRHAHSIEDPVRGPWDHSRAVSLPIDVGSVLALPKPVAISP